VTISDVQLLERTRSLLAQVSTVQQRNPHIEFINMDQTAIQYQMRPITTVDFIGNQSISIALGGGSSERLTVALAVSSRGEKLPMFAIFKASPSGRIRREFTCVGSEYPQSILYAVQRSAWMDETMVLQWISRYNCNITFRVLAPFCLIRDPRNVCLVLDSLSSHRTRAVVSAISQLGINLLYIPGGLTSQFQPLDVGVNGPFKHWVREEWARTDHTILLNPQLRRVNIALLMETGWSRLTADLVANSFGRLLRGVGTDTVRPNDLPTLEHESAASLLMALSTASNTQ
jgi:hypothetical protein